MIFIQKKYSMLAEQKDPIYTTKNSPVHGTGVFAAVTIYKGTKILQYVGEKITKKEAELRPESEGRVFIFELNKKHDIDGNVPYNPARFINHSCDPNAETEIIRGKIWIIAIRDIAQGEEITYNYGYDLDNYEQHPCRCQTNRCVGFILAEEHWPSIKKDETPK